MFTKSQLVAAAALVASAASVMAFPITTDATELEARSYGADALTEIEHRAVMEYLESLEARGPSANVAAGAGAGTSHHGTASAGAHHRPGHGHNGPHGHSHGSRTHGLAHKNSGSHAAHHGANAHHGSHSPHSHSSHKGHSGSTASSHASGSETVKRSFMDYLDELVARAPKTTSSSSKQVNKGKVSEATGGVSVPKHKGTTGKAHQRGQQQTHEKSSKHNRVSTTHGNNPHRHSSAHHGANGVKGANVHKSHLNRHRLTSQSNRVPSTHRGGRLAAPGHVRPHAPASLSSNSKPTSGQKPLSSTSSSLQARELEDLADLIARELELYDDLD